MSYKSVRLLTEAIHAEMDKLRKQLMRMEDSDNRAGVEAFSSMGELRKLFDELAAKADRPTIEDVVKLSPADYVATMKPLVGNYHRQLMVADKLTACLCEDLQANGCVLFLTGDGKTIVRTAVNPNRPECSLAIEALLASIDDGTKQVVNDGVTEAEKLVPNGSPSSDFESEADWKRWKCLLEEAERVGWDTPEGEKLRREAKQIRYDEELQ